MAADTAWPPRSPHAALLGSPSGRRKFLQNQNNLGNHGSPITLSNTTPNLRHMVPSVPGSDEDGEDEDEETLQLKLAAIEAKLKLKKLQQNKAKAKDSDSGGDLRTRSRPSSTVSSYSTAPSSTRIVYGRDAFTAPQSRNAIEVPLSPRKQQLSQQEKRSPAKVLLGIDKGMTGADVSLKRARSVQTGPLKKRSNAASDHERLTSRLSTFGSTRSATSSSSSRTDHPKSFSERMSDARDSERLKENRREIINRARGAGLKLSEGELESFRLAAEEASKHSPPRSPTRQRLEFSREDIIQADRKVLKKSRTLPDLRESPLKNPFSNQKDSFGQDLPTTQESADSTLYEPFSHLNLASRILPDSFLKRTLPTETFTTMRIPDLLRQVTSPAFELPDSVIDFALFGIIASKSSPMDHKTGPGAAKSKGTDDWEKKFEDGSQNQRKFMILQLTDLKWSVDLFLFGTAVPRYHRLTPGTIVAILNPTIMPPKKGKEDTGAFSLTLHSSDDVVLEIGTSRDLGFCNAVKKDGKECGTWVNTAKTEICEFHLNLQVAKAQSARMGVNAGTNGFQGGAGSAIRSRLNSHVPGSKNREDVEGQGLRGLLPRKEGPRYDKYTGSHFYIASSTAGASARGTGASNYRTGASTAYMLDQDDDPFIAEGQMSRDKEGRMRKRLEAQEKEREIARKLGAMGSGGAGGEYLRHRAEKQDGQPAGETGSQKSAMASRNAILSSGAGVNGNGKRTADGVRLSPVKKTRFVTDKGIRVAGRESLGAQGHHADDDGLDIV